MAVGSTHHSRRKLLPLGLCQAQGHRRTVARQGVLCQAANPMPRRHHRCARPTRPRSTMPACDDPARRLQGCLLEAFPPQTRLLVGLARRRGPIRQQGRRLNVR